MCHKKQQLYWHSQLHPAFQKPSIFSILNPNYERLTSFLQVLYWNKPPGCAVRQPPSLPALWIEDASSPPWYFQPCTFPPKINSYSWKSHLSNSSSITAQGYSWNCLEKLTSCVDAWGWKHQARWGSVLLHCCSFECRKCFLTTCLWRAMGQRHMCKNRGPPGYWGL